MNEPTHRWICDTCNQRIENPKDGCLDWHDFLPAGHNRALKLVHKNKRCAPPAPTQEGYVSTWEELAEFLGKDGRKKFRARFPSNTFEDPSEVRRMSKRVFG